MKLAAPLIIAAHVTGLPTLDGWAGLAVYEGAAPRRDDVREYLTLGYVGGTDEPAVTFEAVPTAQGQNREAGTITSQLIVAGPDVAAARGRTFDLIAAWSQWLVVDRTLGGVLSGGSEAHLGADVAIPTTTRSGATTNALVTITYRAVTYG